MGPKGVLLLAGTIVKISYERFGWVNKQFRISNLTYRPDCSVQVTAQEHNDDTYIVTAKGVPDVLFVKVAWLLTKTSVDQPAEAPPAAAETPNLTVLTQERLILLSARGLETATSTVGAES